MWSGGLAKTLIPPPIKSGVSRISVSAISSILKSYQPTLKLIGSKPSLVSKTYQPILKPSEVYQIDWIAFRLIDDIDWHWYQQDHIRFCGKYRQFEAGERVEDEIKLLVTEVKNDIEWKQYKQEPNALIESKYVFRCLYVCNKKLQSSCHIIHQSEFENKYIEQLILNCRARWQDSIEKFELGIQLLLKKDYEGNFLNSYTAKLMVKRCFQIWTTITREQISRGLALTEMGQEYLDQQLADIQAQKVIQKADGEAWKVVKEQGLTPEPGQLLPQNGIEAAKKRAHQWKGTPLP